MQRIIVARQVKGLWNQCPWRTIGAAEPVCLGQINPYVEVLAGGLA